MLVFCSDRFSFGGSKKDGSNGKAFDGTNQQTKEISIRNLYASFTASGLHCVENHNHCDVLLSGVLSLS
jgi:hypothetical protein